MTRDEVLALAEKHAICTSEAHKEFLHDGLMEFASEISAAERKKHQADIERWKGEAEKAEKWRALALYKDPVGRGKIVQEIQREAAEHERNLCAKLCDDLATEWACVAHLPKLAAQECALKLRSRGSTS